MDSSSTVGLTRLMRWLVNSIAAALTKLSSAPLTIEAEAPKRIGSCESTPPISVNEPPGQDDTATGKHEIDLSHQFVAQSDVELLGRHRVERTKVHVARGACNRIEAAGPCVHLTQARGVGDVGAKLAARTAGRYDFVPLREFRSDRLSDGAGCADYQYSHNALETNIIPLFLRSGLPRTPGKNVVKALPGWEFTG